VANQEVNPNVLGNADAHTNTTGKMIMHEATEAYGGAQISQQAGAGVEVATQADFVNPQSVYYRAHNGATPQTPIGQTIYDSNGKQLQMLPNGNYPNNVSRAEWWVIDQNGNRKVIQTLK
jgi:hypothetical protein